MQRVPAMKIYTCFKGVVVASDLVNETPKGYRVKGGKFLYGHVVFKDKQHGGWVFGEQKRYYNERSFLVKTAAEEYANRQLICMELHYITCLADIHKAKERLAL